MANLTCIVFLYRLSHIAYTRMRAGYRGSRLFYMGGFHGPVHRPLPQRLLFVRHY